jgi:hypothetical protein
MVIRFEKRRRRGILPLFDRLSHQKPPLAWRRLTDREVEHRRRMLDHLQKVDVTLRRASSGLAVRPAATSGY